MAGLKFEGDLSQITSQQLKYIESVIEKRGFKNNKVIVEPIGAAGDNYVANVKRITVEDDTNSFKMVAKVAPTQEIARKLSKTEFMFRNETIMYTKVLPKFTQIEKSAGVPPEERLRYAICYGSSDDPPNEVILLEDLNVSNFKMLDRFKSLSPDCVKSVLKNFASLHSLSYALKYQEPESFEEFKNSFYDTQAVSITQVEAVHYFKAVENNVAKLVDNDVHKKALNGSLVGCVKDITKMSQHDRNSKHAIIQQGDAWTNNIMFKFDGEDLLQSVMIDYQASRPANPVSDILYMIFNCTDHETRKKYFYDWIDYYHSELDKALSNYGLKANFVFPRDQLDADLKRHGKISFGLSIILASILTKSTEDAVELKKAMEKEDMSKLLLEHTGGGTNAESNEILKRRLEGLVDSYIQFGLI